MPVSMETVFGRTAKERHLSFYNDYVFYRSTWSFFRCFDLEGSINQKNLEVPSQFSVKNFVTKYLSFIDPQTEESVSFGVPVFCAESAVTLPTSVGERFVSVSRNSASITDEDLDLDPDEDENDPEAATW